MAERPRRAPAPPAVTLRVLVLISGRGRIESTVGKMADSGYRRDRPERNHYRTAGIGAVAIAAVALFVTGCASSPPANPDNICDIFAQKRDWYGDARRASDRWNSPIPVLMAIVYQESSYRARAKPPRRKVLGVIPWRRPDAYGFAQATDAAWSDYVRATGRRRADRDDFGDAMDFVGWYNAESHRRNRIANNDAYRLYLAYHEGHGGFSRGTHRGKSQLQSAARRVADRASNYETQLNGCRRLLKRGGRWWRPF